MSIFDELGILVPDNATKNNKKPLVTLDDVRTEYSLDKDPCGNGARQVECFLRYYFTGKIERVHPLGVADIVIKRGITMEVKTGHGWLIEPRFETLEELENHLDSRKNPMIKASHIAYLPHRAYDGLDCVDCLIFSAIQFIKIMGKYGKLTVKESRGSWGVAIKDWITEGYAVKSSSKVEKAIREDLENNGLIIEEFVQKHNLKTYSF